jgi:hypothetical protein
MASLAKERWVTESREEVFTTIRVRCMGGRHPCEGITAVRPGVPLLGGEWPWRSDEETLYTNATTDKNSSLQAFRLSEESTFSRGQALCQGR